MNTAMNNIVTGYHCFRLCGTKLGCGEGGCGACTVMVSRVNREGGRVEHLSINACLAPVASMHGGFTVHYKGPGRHSSNKLK